MKGSLEVAIIGAGTAGLAARREVARVTDNYAVIDAGPLGTTCARVGCMPSKALIQVAEDYQRRKVFDEIGIRGQLSVDSAVVMKHVRKLRDRFVKSVLADMESWLEGHWIQKRARFVSPHVLDLEGETIEAKKIIIATGSRPLIPKAWQKYSSYFLNTDDFFEMETLPRKVAVIGLGVIGIELGQALQRLGVEVVGFETRRSIGGLTDPEVSNYVVENFSREMNLHFSGADLVGEGSKGLRIRSGDFEDEFEKVLVAVGRKPNLDQLNLEEIGVTLNEKGLPEIVKGTYQIKNFPIYVVGDANAERPVLHEAADEGRIAGYNSVREESQCFTRRVSLGIVFCDPNIAVVGQTYQSLQALGADFITGSVSYEGQGRAIVKLKEKGLVHIYAHRSSGLLLGAEIFAPEGEHLAHLLSWAISLQLNVFDVLKMPFYHPVLEEGLRTALRNLAEKVEQEKPPLEIWRCQDAPVAP